MEVMRGKGERGDEGRWRREREREWRWKERVWMNVEEGKGGEGGGKYSG